jgi:hypothetical protein
MATKPTYKIGDIVYLAESAAAGELEAYKISSIKQLVAGKWLYTVNINQKSPAEQTIMDRVDLKFPTSLLYDETELIPFCEAVDAAITNMNNRITRLNVKYTDCIDTSTGGTGLPIDESTPEGNSKFSIGDTVYIRASAALGFIEGYKIVTVHQDPTYKNFTYTIDLTNTTLKAGLPRYKDNLFFRERELLTLCQSLDMAISALNRKLAILVSKKESLCNNDTTG